MLFLEEHRYFVIGLYGCAVPADLFVAADREYL